MATEEATLDVDDLVTELTRAGFDLRRPVMVSYLIETGNCRDIAFAVRDLAATWDGCTVCMFAETGRWVVLILQTLRVTRHLISQVHHRVLALAEGANCHVRGFTVEDPHVGDDWQFMALRVTADGRDARPDPDAQSAPTTTTGPTQVVQPTGDTIAAAS